MNTPVFSLVTDSLSISLLLEASSLYCATLSRYLSVVTVSTSGCSGASTTYVQPYNVSARVVNTSKLSPLSKSNVIKPPLDLPIQFFCISLVFSGQSRLSRPLISSSAYFVMPKNHCVKSFFITWLPQRSHLPSTTCSLASTVLQLSHQLTGAFLR